MPIISLHLSVSESLLKSLALHLLMYGAILFVVIIIAAFCAGLVLGHLCPSPLARRRRGSALTRGTRQPQSPEVS
jgi:hypothetical protein